MNVPDQPAAGDEFPVLRDVLSMYYSEVVGDGRMYADDTETFTVISVALPDEDIVALCAEIEALKKRGDEEVVRFFAENQRSGLESDPRTWMLSIQGVLCG